MSETANPAMTHQVPACAGTTGRVSRRRFLQQTGGLTFCFAFAGFFGNGRAYAVGAASGAKPQSAELNAYVSISPTGR